MSEEEKALAIAQAEMITNTLRAMMVMSDRRIPFDDFGLKQVTTILYDFRTPTPTK